MPKIQRKHLPNSHKVKQVDISSELGLVIGPYRRIVEAALNAVVMLDQEGEITLVSAQTIALLGYRRKELVGK